MSIHIILVSDFFLWLRDSNNLFFPLGAGQNAAVLVKEARLFAFFDGPRLQIESYTSTWNLDLNDRYTYDGLWHSLSTPRVLLWLTWRTIAQVGFRC